MSNRLEYLVKYSVAPPPSRDYYGLKVLENEISLYLWRISHGPHKTPVVHRAKFAEFDQDQSLQDEIRRGFGIAGEHLLQHVRTIAEGNRNSLLTLPRSLIERISRYLKFTDIVKLASLSHIAYEIFNADSLWQILFKRDKKVKITIEEKEKIRVYGWKQLYKSRQMQTSLKGRKNFRVQSSMNYASDAKVNKSSLRPTSGAPMSASKTISTINIAAREHSELPNHLMTTPLSKTTFDARCRGVNAEIGKFAAQKKTSGSKLGDKCVKKENSSISKVTTSRETKDVSKHGKGIDNQQGKPDKSANKININLKSQENKTGPAVSKTSSLPRNIVENVKSSSNVAQKSHGRIRSKIKSKSKKLATTKSEILNADKGPSDNPFVVRDGDLDLADLIEASLKNIRSPRSIFDHDFSCIQQSDARKTATKGRNEIQDIDRLRQLKPTRSSVITNYLSNKMTRGNEILEKLSEKSEPFSETSCESLVSDKKLLSGGDNGSLSLSEKYMKTRTGLEKSLDWKSRSDPIACENRWDLSTTASFRNQSPTKIESNSADRSFIARRPERTSLLMKTYGPRSWDTKEDILAKHSEIIAKDRAESTRLIKDVERKQLMK